MKNGRILNGEKQIIEVGNLKIGSGEKPIFISGPCSVESKEQMMQTALALKGKGLDVLRGGIFKPRTSPYEFQGLGLDGLRILKEAGDAAGVPIITEVMDESQLSEVLEYVDIIQIGSRNMYNYSLLKIMGQINKPVLLKRGMSATIKEWIMAAEYIAMSGNKKIILCERGIRTYDTYTRNTLDLAAVPIMQMETGLPIIVDPSHATGMRSLIAPMSRAAIAAGADGLMVEVHIRPDEALCDGPQSLTPEAYHKLIDSIKL
jgi:3-deoxy-7-phosphoheptulonate synthase